MVESIHLQPQDIREFTTLRDRAEREANSGNLQEALKISEEMVEWAERIGERSFQDRAFCCLSATLIALGRGEEVIGRLRRLLMQSSDPIPQHVAAYNLSLYYDSRDSFSKSTFYAKLALDHARRAQKPDQLVRSLNRLANALNTESKFGESSRYLTEALDILATKPEEEKDKKTIWLQGVLRANLGSCLVLSGEPSEGILQLSEARRSLRGNPLCSEDMIRRIHLSLGFGYLQLGRASKALDHAKAATVELSKPLDPDLQRRALFVLGEASKLAGDQREASRWYRQLQEDFHPEFPELVELLLHTDTRDIVNPWI